MLHNNPTAAIKDLNAILRHLEKNRDLVLRYPKLHKDSLELKIYRDASFAGNDGTSRFFFF